MDDDLELLQEIAQQRAVDIISGNISSKDDLILSLRFILCKTYNIPLFDNYFNNLTIPELLLEVALHNEASKPKDARTSELASQLKEEEVDDLFGDMEKEDQNTNTLSEEDLSKVYEEFMQTGKFIGEGNNA